MNLNILTAFSLRHPVSVVLVTVCLTALFVYGLGRAKVENGFRSYLGDESEELSQLTAFIEQFGGGVPVVAVYDCLSGTVCTTVFDPVPLEMAHRIFEEVRSMEGVSEVYTPADSRLLVSVPPDDFETHRLFGNPRLTELAGLAAVDPLWDRVLVAQGGAVGAIVVQFETADPTLQREATLRLRQLTEDYAELGFVFRFVGESVDFTLGTDALKVEQDRIMPWLMLSMCLTIAGLFRSAWAILPAMATMGLATVFAQGLMGLLGVPVDATTQNVLSVVLVVGICDAIHFLARYASSQCMDTAPATPARVEELIRVAGEISSPCFWTSATTIVAFLSFLSSDFDSFRYFGIFCAFGVLAALVVTFTVLPMILCWLPPRAVRSAESVDAWDDAANYLVDLTSRSYNTIIAGVVLIVLVAAYGMTQLRLDTNISTLMGASNPLIEWSDWIEDHMRSPESLEVEIVIPEPLTVVDLEALTEMQAVEEHLEEAYLEIGPVRSILDPVRRINYFLGGKSSDSEELPASDILLADIFVLIDRETKDQWVSVDKRHVRLSAEATSMNTSQQRQIVNEVELYLDRSLPTGWRYRLTGSVPIFDAMMSRLLATQVKALVGAGIAVLLCLLVYFRFDLLLVALAILPNALPVLAVLGFVGLAGIPLNVGIVIVGPMVIGLAVDDTIHLFSEYGSGVRRGLGSEMALHGAIRRVQRPIVTSSGSLCVGFLTLSVVTRYGVIQTFGVVLSLAILAALVADLLLVPALIHRFPRAASGVASS